jgi:hypothetical protein
MNKEHVSITRRGLLGSAVAVAAAPVTGDGRDRRRAPP